MTQQQPDIQVRDIDHLGIIAGMIDQMGLVNEVNQLVGTHAQEQVSRGQVLKAMILNGLGFVSAPLYLFEQFFVGKATEHLIGEGVQPEHLNDDRLGRALDKFHQVGVTKLFMTLAMRAVKQFGISMPSIHLDSSSFHVDGEYQADDTFETAAAEIIAGIPQHCSSDRDNQESLPSTIVITHGYSRDHRPDLKQFIIDTICTADGDIPLYLRVADGNENDKAVFASLMQDFQQQWTFDGLCVSDSALYTADNLQAMKELKWLTRVPLTINEANFVLSEIQGSEQWLTSNCQGYRIAERQSNYAGVEQRWFVIESEQRKVADIKQLNKRIEKQLQQQQAKLRLLCSQVFASEPDARQAASKFETALKYHRLSDLQFIPLVHYDKAGRPGKDQQPSRVTYQIQATLVANQAVIESSLKVAGRFILATNVLEPTELTPEQALLEYKDQQSNERGFRFLKDPLFFTSSVFVKSPKRVEALAMVMAVCLLVYSLAQRQLRIALAQAGQTIKNQVGKVTQRPTMRWVFQSFQAVHLVWIDGVKQISNLTTERQRILRFLGSACQKYYLLC